jgi:hypothetical protein
VSIGTYWARTATTGLTGNDQSYQGRADYNADRYGARAEFLDVDKNFSPQVGFTRRTDFKRSFAELRFSPRPTRMTSVRKFTYSGNGEYVVNGAGIVDSRLWTGHFGAELESSDQLTLDVTRDYERLAVPFQPAGSTTPIPAGGYRFGDLSAAFIGGAHRSVSGTIAVRAGSYYDGTIRSVTFGTSGMNTARMSLLTRLSVEPTLSLVHIDRPGGPFSTTLSRARVDYGFSPLMFASGLIQYSSADRAVSTNLRFRWEYLAGSELFVVYTDERDTTDPALAPPTLVRGLKNRAFVVKVTRLLRF